MTELKPCPFCGGEARISINSDTNIVFGEETWAIAFCGSCGIRTPRFYFCPEQNERCEAEMMVTKRWNRRTAND